MHFSVGGTGRKVIKEIYNGFETDKDFIEIDLTKEEVRNMEHAFDENDIVLFAVMTMSNVFGPENLFDKLKGKSTALIPIAMCGNQFTGVALPRMRKDLEKKGFITVAAGTFIGKHSCQPGVCDERPDMKDISVARNFGRDIWNKLVNNNKKELSKNIKADRPKITSPTRLWSNMKISIVNTKKTTVNPLVNAWCQFEVDDKCINCGLCVKGCPMKAIEMTSEGPEHDQSKCIGCFKCVNICPKKAVSNNSKQLHFFEKEADDYTERKEAVLHI